MGKVEGQAAWQKIGLEPSSDEMRELAEIRRRLREGTVLSYAEQRRLEELLAKEKLTTRVL